MFAAIFFIAVAYLLGSVNSAIIVSQVMKLPDPRSDGSKNPGATNVLRLSGKQAAMIVLAVDILKGLLAVWIARMFGVAGFAAGLVAIAAVVGHIFPVFYDFKGGKGVATSIGASFGLFWVIGLIAALIWGGVAKFYRISSLASLCAVASTPIIALLTGQFGLIIPLLIMAGIVAFKHQENIKRLQAGTEPTIGCDDKSSEETKKED